MVLADAEVTSNIVGYETKTGITRQTFTAIGNQFASTTNVASRAVKIKDLLDITNARSGNSALATVDQIHVYTGTGWKIYYNQTGVGFVASDAADKTVPTEDTVNVGDGVFFRRANYNQAATVTTSGGIYSGESVSYTLTRQSFTFIAYPWPVEFPINGFLTIMTNPRAGNSAIATVDQVHVYTGTGWKVYYNQTGVGFVASDAADKTVPTEDTISMGTCVFFRRANYNQNAVITFTKPEGI